MMNWDCSAFLGCDFHFLVKESCGFVLFCLSVKEIHACKSSALFLPTDLLISNAQYKFHVEITLEALFSIVIQQNKCTIVL